MADTSRPDTIGFSITELRPWDLTLLERYRPRYHPVQPACSLCALGPCDLAQGRRGACGQDLDTFAAREALLLAVMGAAAHAAHARDVLDRTLAAGGPDLALDLGRWVHIRLPITQIVAGVRPRRLADLVPVLDYVERTLVRLLAAAHFGGESHPLDLESKTLHAGTMDITAMEVADVAQIAAYSFPRGEAETPLLRLGFGDLSDDRPLILCVGHHSDVGHRLVHLVEATGAAVEVAGLCCTAHDMARAHTGTPAHSHDHDHHPHGHGHGPRIIGNLRDQLRFARAGRADVVIADQQCIRLDLLAETLRTGAFYLATSDQACAGLPDETQRDPAELAADLATRPVRAAFIADPERAAAVALALAESQGRVAAPAAPAAADAGADLWLSIDRCIGCQLCTDHCPLHLPVATAVYDAQAITAAAGPQAPKARPALAELYPRCLACGRCDAACPVDIAVMALLEDAAAAGAPVGWVRTGRGPIDDYEIKATGPSIVLGDIPGVVAFLTCPEYPDGRDAAAWMAGQLAQRGYIVLAAGCAAMDLGWGEETAYRRFPGGFDMGGVVNTGSCVSSAHALGALIKVAAIFLHRRLDGNYTEIADYILNRVGAVGALWGGITPKSFAAAAGANRLGVPVVFGPQGRNFRRMLQGAGAAGVIDARSGRRTDGPPVPADLAVVADTREEALVQIVRLCLRPNDTTWGRQTKLRHYLELCAQLLGHLPPDLAACVRVADDLPAERRPELLTRLEAEGWQPSFIPDPTLLQGLVRP